jgi:regulator of nucleoside diphosphate kinase
MEMHMRAIQPDLFITRSHHKHLKKVIAEAFRNRDRIAPFLSAEIRRAAMCDDQALSPERVVPGRQVSYCLDGGPASAYRTLVYPEDWQGDAGQISLLSPIGTALLGLSPGDQMLVFLPESGFHKLQVEGVRAPVGE